MAAAAAASSLGAPLAAAVSAAVSESPPRVYPLFPNIFLLRSFQFLCTPPEGNLESLQSDPGKPDQEKRGGRVSPRLVARSYLDYQTIINTILCHSFSVQNRLPFLHS